MRKLLLVFCLTVLTACATTPQSPAQAVYVIKSNYLAALTVALQYKALPDCASTTAALCSKPEIVQRIQAADNAAYPLLQTAQSLTQGASLAFEGNITQAVQAAEQAVTALVSLTQTLQVK